MAFFNSLPFLLKTFGLNLVLFTQFLVAPIISHTVVVQPPSITTPPVPTSIASPVTAKNATSTALNKKVMVGAPTQKPLKPALTNTATSSNKISSTTVTAVAIHNTEDISGKSVPINRINELTTGAQNALVNIICANTQGGQYSPVSSSGVIIDDRGIILTSAHMAQYFLLQNYPTQNNIDCSIRGGSPAQLEYKAKLLYLPPAWIDVNAKELIVDHPTGTGESDYAFLLITKELPTPSVFPSLSLTTTTPEENAEAIVAGYPAQTLSATSIQNSLYSSTAIVNTLQLFSFKGNVNVDVVSLSPSIVSQSGSSGGAAVGAVSGKMFGIITTQTSGASNADRILNAVTIAYINRSLTEGGLGGIAGLLSGDLNQKANDFNAFTAPDETAQLIKVLQSRTTQ